MFRPTLILGLVLAPLAAKFILTKPDSPRAADPCALADEIAAIRPDAELEVQEDIAAALSAAAPCGTAAVVGSFYLAGSALKILGGQQERPC